MIRKRIASRGAGRLAGLVLGVVALLSSSPKLQAQEITATVAGTVTDTQGALTPGVTVTVQNVDTNVSSEVQTDRDGSYRVTKLRPGHYRIKFALQGFQTFVRDGVVLRTAETGTVNAQLSVGTLEEAITVTGDLSGIESNQSALAQIMENKQISELPLNGRQVYMLLQLTSGTLFTQTQFGAQGFSGTRAWDVNGNITIQGSRTGNNEFLIDGGSTSGTGGWSYAPPVDAIEEFKVQTASTDASYGRTSGGVVNLTLKSGTNDFHGSATGLYRGTALDTNSVQNIRNNISNSGHKYFNGEMTLSGPIQRDKTFFMVGYQGFTEDIPFPTTRTVPTDLQLQGDFSQTFDSTGKLIVIYDPRTTRPDPANPGRFIRDPFPGNKIPLDRFDPVSRALLPLIPRSNAKGDITGANNFINSPNLGFYRYNSYLTRIDHHFSSDHRTSLSHSANWGNERRAENGLPPGPMLRSDNWPTERKSYLAVLDDLITLNSSTLLNTRVSFDRFDEPHFKEFGPSAEPLPFSGPHFNTPVEYYPQLVINGYQEMGPRPDRQTKNDIFSLQSSLSKVSGRHSFKTGAEYRRYRLFRADNDQTNGRYAFNGDFTRRDPERAAGPQNAFASFLLGIPDDGGGSFIDNNVPSDRLYPSYGVFVQDEWKVDSKLALSLGLRWDYQPPVTEKNDRIIVGFDPSTPGPVQVPGLVVRGGLLYAGVDGNGRTPYKGDWNNIQPRASLSYAFNERIIGRANYGRSFFGTTGGGIEGIVQNGFNSRTPFVSSIQTGIPNNTLSRPYPEGFVPALGNSRRLATGIGTEITFQNPDFEIPYTDQWMAGFTFKLPWEASLDVAYVGNKVNKLNTNTGNRGRSLNDIPRAEREKGIANPSYLSGQVPNPFVGVAPGTGLNASTVSRQQLLRPYPQFTGIVMNLDNRGWSRYNAFEIGLKKRAGKSFVSAVNYTWSRLYEATQYQNNGFDDAPVKDLGSIDRTHHLTLNVLWELPLKGSQLVEGWQLNLIYEIASGTPTAMPNGVLRQDSVKLPKGQQSIDKWFDNSTKGNPRPDGGYAWEPNPPNAFRSVSYRMKDVRDPYISNMSISLFKNTRVGARTVVQLRGELFNPFNIKYYGGPNTTITDTQFGKITPDQFNFPRQGQLGLRVYF
jgi:outer membrane receptor protein involved in Fe transport